MNTAKDKVVEVDFEEDTIKPQVEVVEEVKPKWSLKKKLLLGGGVLLGFLAAGALALGRSNQNLLADEVMTNNDEEENDVSYSTEDEGASDESTT